MQRLPLVEAEALAVVVEVVEVPHVLTTVVVSLAIPERTATLISCASKAKYRAVHSHAKLVKYSMGDACQAMHVQQIPHQFHLYSEPVIVQGQGILHAKRPSESVSRED
jgi:hypothetical protein